MRTTILVSIFILSSFLNAQHLNGSWLYTDGNQSELILIQDNYLTKTLFTNTEFKETIGGTVQFFQNEMVLNKEFDSNENELGKVSIKFKLKNDRLTIAGKTYEPTAQNSSELAGVWKISARKQDNKIVEIHQTGSRKTLKILTGNYFQWFAIDPAENKFYGSGGGIFSFENGKYTENIVFFSRDNKRVGASLQFDGTIKDGQWRHSGLSSKGEPIDEIWIKAY